MSRVLLAKRVAAVNFSTVVLKCQAVVNIIQVNNELNSQTESKIAL